MSPTVPLGRCDVDWHADGGIIALACVGRDIIKVWPPPVEGPWLEDATRLTLAHSSQTAHCPAGQVSQATSRGHG
jgi:hypothetical protein